MLFFGCELSGPQLRLVRGIHVPLEPMMDLVCKIPRRKRYLWHLVDMLWAHIAREMSEGHFAAELKHGLRKSLADGHLPRERVPEDLQPILFKHLESCDGF